MKNFALTKNLSPVKFICVELMMLLPIGNYGLLLWHFGMPMVSLLTYLFVCLLLMPVLYLLLLLGKVSSEAVNLGGSLANIMLNLNKQLKWGFLAFFVSGLIVALSLYASFVFLNIWDVSHIKWFMFPDTEVIIISFLLLTFHPVLEELFWRGFLQVFMVGGMTYEHPPEVTCWYIAIHYAAMYIFIFANFTQHLLIAVICALPFLLVARKFTLYRHKGILTSIIGHIGLNLGFVIMLNIFYWNHWSINHLEKNPRNPQYSHHLRPHLTANQNH